MERVKKHKEYCFNVFELDYKCVLSYYTVHAALSIIRLILYLSASVVFRCIPNAKKQLDDILDSECS